MWREERFIDTVLFNYLDGLCKMRKEDSQAAASVFTQRFLVTVRLPLAFIFVRFALLGFPGKMQFLRIMSLNVSCRLPHGRQLPPHLQICRPPPAARAHLPSVYGPDVRHHRYKASFPEQCCLSRYKVKAPVLPPLAAPAKPARWSVPTSLSLGSQSE